LRYIGKEVIREETTLSQNYQQQQVKRLVQVHLLENVIRLKVKNTYQNDTQQADR
jgi:hypothetical protein